MPTPLRSAPMHHQPENICVTAPPGHVHGRDPMLVHLVCPSKEAESAMRKYGLARSPQRLTPPRGGGGRQGDGEEKGRGNREIYLRIVHFRPKALAPSFSRASIMSRLPMEHACMRADLDLLLTKFKPSWSFAMRQTAIHKSCGEPHQETCRGH